jgi:predicted PurR-regulated permease PerM
MENNINTERDGRTFFEKHPNFATGFFAFIVIAACIAFYFSILRIDFFINILSKFFDIIMPLIYGIVIAFLINPLVRVIENLFTRLFYKKSEKPLSRKKHALVRSLSIMLTLILIAVVIFLAVSFLIPELAKSILHVSHMLPQQLETLNVWARNILYSQNFFSISFEEILAHVTGFLNNWLKTIVNLETGFGYLASGVMFSIGIIFNLVVGLACSVYLMYNREKFWAQCKKIVFSLFKETAAKKAVEIAGNSYDILAHSIIGKIIDSIVLGFICLLGVTLIGTPYGVLISFIVGVTNVIPFFGPWLGGVPCVLLVFLVDPFHALYLAIFILCLQQFDQNFLTPKIVGSYVGLPALWVLVSCLLGGGFFGIKGLILGVPIFAILYHLFKEIVEYRLEKKNLPVNTNDYYKKKT